MNRFGIRRSARRISRQRFQRSIGGQAGGQPAGQPVQLHQSWELHCVSDAEGGTKDRDKASKERWSRRPTARHPDARESPEHERK